MGPEYPYELKAGDKVCWVRHEGKKIIYSGEIYFKVKERWVLGVLKD
ncbi:MAG: hypothetical protein Q7S42_01340 [Candidatus Omnitrophota bacterium]|nr:hypothetical protein [Candidatus Omnitrophota bacterium]